MLFFYPPDRLLDKRLKVLYYRIFDLAAYRFDPDQETINSFMEEVEVALDSFDAPDSFYDYELAAISEDRQALIGRGEVMSNDRD